MKEYKQKLGTLSVVMPCLNEEDNVAAAILRTLQAFDSFGIDGNIIVVNDGSSDRTADVVSDWFLRDNRVSMICHDKPRGLGASFWHGATTATGDFVTLIPGDNENDPSETFRYFYLSKDVDIVVPFIMNVEVRSYVRRFISTLYRLIINLSFGTNLNYTNGTVIYNQKLLPKVNLKSTGFFYQSEILVKLIHSGCFYAEVPHLLSEREGGKSTALSIRSLYGVMRSYLWLIWDIHITRQEGIADSISYAETATYRRHHGL